MQSEDHRRTALQYPPCSLDPMPLPTILRFLAWRPSQGTKLYCLVNRGTLGVNNLPRVVARIMPRSESNPRPLDHESSALTTTPPSHLVPYVCRCPLLGFYRLSSLGLVVVNTFIHQKRCTERTDLYRWDFLRLSLHLSVYIGVFLNLIAPWCRCESTISRVETRVRSARRKLTENPGNKNTRDEISDENSYNQVVKAIGRHVENWFWPYLRNTKQKSAERLFMTQSERKQNTHI